MASSLPLDTRQARITRRLLDQAGPASVDDLATALKLTDRMVRYNLASVEGVLEEHGLSLARRPGVGIWVEGSASRREELRAALDRWTGPSVLDPDDRHARILLALLTASPEPIRSEAIEVRLGVSRPTVRRDMREAEGWLEQHRLHLRRMPGRGIAVAGSEIDIRGGLLALCLEIGLPATTDHHETNGSEPRGGPAGVPAWIDGATDIDAFLAALELPVFRAMLATELPDIDDREPTITATAMSLAIAALRMRTGRPVRLGAGRLRSLLDHPASTSAARIAAAVGRAIGMPPGRSEIAAITESLLGLTLLADVAARPEAADMRYIDQIIAAAAERLHASLADDTQLRSSLSEHVRRLHVRLRYGLPISNPLQNEVRKRYPDVYRAASEILVEVGPVGGLEMPDEEIGLLTMYLAGSLERQRLRRTVRVTVVCPAGMATAWILVSRLAAEFPQFEIVRVVSKAAFETEAGDDPDLVISTIPLEDLPPSATGLVVSPLLRAADVRHIGRVLAARPD